MNIKLLEIRLLKSSFALNTEILAEGKEFSIERELIIGIAKDDSDKKIKVDLQIKTKNEDSPFLFNIVYEGSFEIISEEEPTQHEINKIGAINCGAIIYPYLREHLADLTRRAGVPPFHLPPINFVSFYRDKNEEVQQSK